MPNITNPKLTEPDIPECTPSALLVRSRLRALGLSRRDKLSDHDRHLFSQRACSHMIHYLERKVEDFSQTIISGYWPIRSEIDPRPVLHFVSSRGGCLALPAVLDRTTMVFRKFSEGMSLEPMQFGTVGPGSDSKVISPTIIIAPLSVFDRQGHRLGYGGGYYDRAVEKLQKHTSSVHLFGLGFSCQEVKSIPSAPHDLVLQRIFTEKGFIEC